MPGRWRRWLVAATLALAVPALAERSWQRAIDDAERAIDSGMADPEYDLRPVVDALKTARDPDEQRKLVEALSDFGDAGGSSPADVKRWIVAEATPVLEAVASRPGDAFVRGDAIFALRSIGAPRAVLERVAAMAERDADSFVQSRGEILRNYVRGLPAEAPAATLRPRDPEGEAAAIAALKAKRLGVSLDQLRRSAMMGQPDEVRALLAAGVDPNGPELNESPLYSAAFSGCGSKQGETDDLVRVVELLLAARADVRRKDDNGNTILTSAAQMCGPRIVGKLLAAGADPNVVNGSGVSPLGMALIMKRLEAAELLVDKGARLDARQAQMMAAIATEPRAKAIVARATVRGR